MICPFCNKKVASQRGLATHVTQSHPSQKFVNIDKLMQTKMFKDAQNPLPVPSVLSGFVQLENAKALKKRKPSTKQTNEQTTVTSQSTTDGMQPLQSTVISANDTNTQGDLPAEESHAEIKIPDPIYCKICAGFGFVGNGDDRRDCDNCNQTGFSNWRLIQMATKKTARRVKKERKAAAPAGRERKLLLRLSTDEYNKLQAKAEKQGTSMANLLRSSAIG